uniref:Klotho beta n=1 Tax=Sinocyclocheilus grahami TaxID=75366 RepID=A0A672SNM8_SINGR
MSGFVGFLWGVGTAAFPTEGSWDADGKGESVWDCFTRHTDPSSNSYIQWEEDLESVRYLGVNFYAFSLSWTRIFPDGNAKAHPNPAGVQHYQHDKIVSLRVFGYTAWSLLDGFEWNHGYSMRTGLFYIDFSKPERHRVPKTSAHFYRRVIRVNFSKLRFIHHLKAE